MVRIDEAVAAAAADRMPALALTDLANVFGMVKFYKAARARGVKPIIGCDVWMTHESERDAPHRLLLLCQSREGYLRLADWLTRAYRTNQHRGRAELRRAWFAEGTEGLIAALGVRRAATSARRWRRATRSRRAPPRARGRQLVPRPLLPRSAARGPRRRRRADRRDGAPRGANCRCRSSPRTRCSSRRAKNSARTRRACASPRATCSPIRGGRRRFTPEQYFKTQDEMARRFADLPEALANSVAIAQRCNLTIPLGKNYLPAFPTPAGRVARSSICTARRAPAWSGG